MHFNKSNDDTIITFGQFYLGEEGSGKKYEYSMNTSNEYSNIY